MNIRHQVDFYEQSAHLVRTNTQRSPNYQELFQNNFFPFAFLRTSWLVHDLTSEEGRDLRCEIYDEHASWGNAGMEELAMGFVLAKRTVKMQIGPMAPRQGGKGPEEWQPMTVPRGIDDEDEKGGTMVSDGPAYLDYLDVAQKAATDKDGAEVFVSFLPREKS